MNTISKSKILTITGKGDGFGAQYQAIISGLAFARFNGYIYRHTPFNKIEHIDYPKEMELFCGFKSDNEDDISREIDIIDDYINEIHNSKTPDIYYNDDFLEEIRELYMSTPKPDNCKYNVAVHIRRGDVIADSNCHDINIRYTPNETYLIIMNYIRTQYKNATFCIYSEGKEKDFEILKKDDVYFSLNDNIKKTFHELVTADILVTAKSSFSYCAALLSYGKIFYIPFWHYPLKKWIICNDNKLNLFEYSI